MGLNRPGSIINGAESHLLNLTKWLFAGAVHETIGPPKLSTTGEQCFVKTTERKQRNNARTLRNFLLLHCKVFHCTSTNPRCNNTFVYVNRRKSKLNIDNQGNYLH
ncbi:hypothetical protein GTP58_27140 [Duganella sp. CY15W]|uniref:hypothetical protein n=1 Tax=Duganella sp. CY15W TaxID=2692172 RepID=UPI001371BE71|nr:hypothetical protein [Duganella sp. CY15W]MYM32014.1 hypothetical protein [Duganella sp. CY15W]